MADETNFGTVIAFHKLDRGGRLCTSNGEVLLIQMDSFVAGTVFRKGDRVEWDHVVEFHNLRVAMGVQHVSATPVRDATPPTLEFRL
jgi:hypothetical protein